MNKILSNWYKGDGCRAPGLLSSEEEEEIITASEGVEEAEEEPDLDLAYDELEAIKQRLKNLRGKLMLTPTDPCQLEGTFSSTEDVCCLTPSQIQLQKLRRKNSALRCQLQRQVLHLRTSRKELKLLDAMRCQLQSKLQKMNSDLNAFKQFKHSAKHQFGLCIERNEQLKASKIDESDFKRLVREAINHLEGSMCYLVPMRCHHRISYQMSMEVLLIRFFLHTLFSNMVEDWNFCKKRLKANCRFNKD